MTPFHIDIDAQTFFFVAGLSYVIGLFLAGTLAVAVNRPFFGWVAKAFRAVANRGSNHASCHRVGREIKLQQRKPRKKAKR